MRHFNIFFSLVCSFFIIMGCTRTPNINSPRFNQANLIEIFFNQPGANRHSMVDPDIDDRIIHLFDSAKESIYFSFYGFSHEGIADSMIRAVKRGLDVQFAGDYNHYSRREVGYMKFEDAVRRYPNALMSVGNSQSIMHNKWAVVDRQFIFTGTGNISNSGTRRNDNVWFIIRSKDLAEDFINEHQQMMNGRFGVGKEVIDTNTAFCIGGYFEDDQRTKNNCKREGSDGTEPGIFLENYFSPQEDAVGRFITEVRNARDEVDYMIFAFTHDAVGRALTAQHRRFILANARDNGNRRVRGLLDRSQFSHAQYVEVYRLASYCPDSLGHENNRCDDPMDMRRDGNENTNVPGDWQGGGGRLHSKAMIIDPLVNEPKSLVGSFNWSVNASTNNDENLVIIHDSIIAERMLEKFEELYALAPPLPGDQARYQEIVISEVNWAGSTRAICFDGDGRRIAYDTSCANKMYYSYDGNEFVELYNPNDRPVDISYWSLYFPFLEADSYDSRKKRAVVGFPEGTQIPAKGFFVVWEPDQRNDLQDAYAFQASQDLIVYSPYNGLSNFMSLYDRRDGNTSFAGCQPAFSSVTTRFPNSNQWNPGVRSPSIFGFKIELRDNRGNLVDLVGTNSAGNAARIERGGISTSLPAPGADTWGSAPPAYTCPAVHYSFSMERRRNADGSWGRGDEWNSWANSQTAGRYIASDFKERTFATPGEDNTESIMP